MKLTIKQQKFADYYIESGNATESYIRAGYKTRTKSIAEVGGCKLLKNSKVKEYIEKILEELSSERIADAKEVLEYLTSVMRREHRENVVVTLINEASSYEPDKNGAMRKRITKKEVAEMVEIPAKLSDANKAAELLGKRYRLFTDKIDIDVKDTITFMEDLSVDE